MARDGDNKDWVKGVEMRFVKAPLEIDFQECDDRYEEFKREFDKLSESDEDPVGQWLKMAKARGETSDSDQVLLTLVTELHRKLDTLTKLVKGEEVSYLSLKNSQMIDSIGYEYFKLKDGGLIPQKEYYARISLPVFPKREVPIFFRAYSLDIAEILLIHERDEKDWNSYVAARERAMIREMKKGKKDD